MALVKNYLVAKPCSYFFKCFSLRSRKDLRDLFDQLAMSCRSLSDSSLNDTSVKNSPEHSTKVQQKIGKLSKQQIQHLKACGRVVKAMDLGFYITISSIKDL